MTEGIKVKVQLRESVRLFWLDLRYDSMVMGVTADCPTEIRKL